MSAQSDLLSDEDARALARIWRRLFERTAALAAASGPDTPDTRNCVSPVSPSDVTDSNHDIAVRDNPEASGDQGRTR